MHLPFSYDDLLNDEDGLETNGTTVRDVNKKDLRDLRDSDFSFIDTAMVDWTSSDYLSDDVWDSLISESVSGMFSRTFFDDIACELELDNTYDSLFALTIPSSNIDIDNVLITDSRDCMWGGLCGGHDHKPQCNKHRACRHCVCQNAKQPTAGAPGQTAQQSVLKPNLRNAGIPIINMINTPHTPPMSDSDGECKKVDKPKIRHGSTSSEIDETEEELREYFENLVDAEDQTQQLTQQQEEDEESSEESSESSSEESEDEAPQQQAGPSRAMPDLASLRYTIRATQNDHSYHKEKSSAMTSDLGIDTPSDSEEEIDVETVSDKKYPVGARMGYIPPTNPPNGGRRVIQRPEPSMTPARNNNNIIKNNNNNNSTNNRNGVKVMLPTKRNLPAANCPPAKRRAAPAAPAAEPKGRKPRQTRANNTGRRRSKNGQESDFDDENEHPPIEKRNLHNDMERQRRVDLRKAFEDLRKLVPEVSRKERAAKVVILREAAKFCNHLTNTSRNMEQRVGDLRSYQEKLIWKLSCLRRQAAKENGVVFSHEDYDEQDD